MKRKHFWQRVGKHDGAIYGFYSLIALGVLLPLLQPGFVLTLDMVFTPTIRMPAAMSNTYLFATTLHLLNRLVASDVLEKLLLLLIIWLAGVGMHRLVRSLATQPSDHLQTVSAYFAGLLYAVNPFSYERFMAGQYELLLGYALLPWFVNSLLDWLSRPTRKSTIILSAWAIGISIVSIHAVGFMVLLSVIGLMVKLWQQRHSPDVVWRLTQATAGLICLYLIASSYWLVPLLLGHGKSASVISSFTTSDQTAFATIGRNSIEKIGNVLRLQGFWAENRNLFILPQTHLPVWRLIGTLLWVVIVIGAMSLWRHGQKLLVICLGFTSLLSIILAIGTFNSFLVSHIPLFAGYREPQKFVALVALADCAFAGQGFAVISGAICRYSGRILGWLAAAALFAIPAIWVHPIWWGFGRQLIATQYPGDWYTMNTRLDRDHSSFRTLFLPWHLYMPFAFAGRIIANPAPQFFDKPILISNDPEFAGASVIPDVRASRLTTILIEAGNQADLGKQLAAYHIKYVLLSLDYDYLSYGYLDRQPSLRVIAQSTSLRLYLNEDFRE
ncbi:MAG TPA: hypothetical protein VGS08_01155 [Candidatus Saccharimonadales bacterium]|nr:hypothetical protein [Candidatus Saccharimonadales bacterium]